MTNSTFTDIDIFMGLRMNAYEHLIAIVTELEKNRCFTYTLCNYNHTFLG